ncbi:bifunctional DNA primase/polymerase [Streptomyces acidiscabies]|uniref:Bifunctional DNA primase/polymerase n=4 Tax=Streptomyces acidiscabies TaxID=42234 RepID=A0AAP6EHD8_9ACTN|nr:bifunctional DNA primase/polymerase [Streptomyces acidiscabies]MDX2962271.1 bifunctional DNA primase/polymerase [Streptomyces acidiscabies]MDX3019723.1 bifunctional DNA primase/polymerase [Streptomyces acidiscabies]MDX3792290.1 bifunctional DNA primase/polymerase [Streptomyces acidiscabies]
MATTDRQATTLALAHALSAAERGLAVIPLSRTKLPALRSPHRLDPPGTPPCHGECGRPGHGVYDATADPARIRALFAMAPWATGYGIACGLPPHRLIGVDLDTKGDTDSTGALRELGLRHLFTIPPTVVVITPSGGRHLWLTGPPEVVVPNSAGRLAPGIDIRGAGGYLVGPGSRTERGVYGVAPGTGHLAPAACPWALLRLLVAPGWVGGSRGGAGGGSGFGGGGGSRAGGDSGSGSRSGSNAESGSGSGAGAGSRSRAGLGSGARSGTGAGSNTGAGSGSGAGSSSRTGSGSGFQHGQGLVHFVLSAHEGQRNTRLFWAACRAYENGLALSGELLEAALRTGLTEREARSTLASAARLTGWRGEGGVRR